MNLLQIPKYYYIRRGIAVERNSPLDSAQASSSGTIPDREFRRGLPSWRSAIFPKSGSMSCFGRYAGAKG
jgi:hypothetical protein